MGARSATTSFLSGFLTHRLTGRFVDSTAAPGRLPAVRLQALPRGPTPATGSGRRPRSTRAGCRSWCRPTERLGELTRGRGRGHGAAGRPPVIAAAADKACEVLGSGALDAGRRRHLVRHDGDRSTRRSPATSSRSRSSRPSRPRSPARGRSRPRSTAATGWSSGSSASSATARSPSAAARGRRPRGPVRRARPRRCRPGSMGLLLQPYWSPGVRIPGPEAQGRDHRLRRRPHPRPPLPGDPRGPGLRAARGRRADGGADAACRSRGCASRAAARRARPRSS